MRRLGAGASFEEFGTAPIALDFHLDAYEGPGWGVKQFRGRSGWLMVAKARLPMPFITWRRTLVACISDQGEVFAPSIANVVFSIPTSLPRAVEEYAPDTLDEVMDDLYRDFLARAEQDNLAYLGEAQERTETKVTAFEAECRALEGQIAGAMRILRERRRRAGTTVEMRADIDTKLARFSAMADDLGPTMRERVRDMRAEDDLLEQIVFASIGKKGMLESSYTVRWRGRERHGRLSFLLPLQQIESGGRDPWGSRLPFNNSRLTKFELVGDQERR